MDTMNKNYNKNELIERYLSDEYVEEFDAIVANAGRHTHSVKTFCWSAVALVAAACVAIVVFVSAPKPASSHDLSGIQIAEGIQQIMKLDLGEVEAITAKPMGDKAMLTAKLKDGSTYTYIMTCNEDDGSTSILACN